MNSKDRSALVDELVQAYYEADPITICDGITDDGMEINSRRVHWDGLTLIQQKATVQKLHRQFGFALPIIDRLLAERAVPDADHLERTAKALLAADTVQPGDFRNWDTLPDDGYAHPPIRGRSAYRDMARAALAAAADAEWLDVALNRVGADLWSIHDGKKGPASPHWYEDPPEEKRYTAQIHIRRDPVGQGYWTTVYRGTGPTRKAAILNAVDKALEVRDAS